MLPKMAEPSNSNCDHLISCGDQVATTVVMTFDLLTSESDQFIVVPKGTKNCDYCEIFASSS